MESKTYICYTHLMPSKQQIDIGEDPITGLGLLGLTPLRMVEKEASNSFKLISSKCFIQLMNTFCLFPKELEDFIKAKTLPFCDPQEEITPFDFSLTCLTT